MAAANSFKVVVMGAAGVGKTCFIIQLVSGKFVESYDPTLEDSYRKQICVDNQEVVLDIFDTAGQEDFSAVRDSYMNTGDGFIIMYSIIDLKSFNEVTAIHTKLEMIQEGARVPGVIVGNKCDSDDSRQVTTDQGKTLANQFNWGFLEASAKLRKNITEVFQEITRKMMKHNQSPNSSTTDAPSGRRRGGCILL
eukprot:TRINITY_DN10414_c0_g1_i1.p1 TRINITY_DN10414_c0_g1~~TRINITY_DN10414_c0_g1_i1.p1  ORF type:complete len:194 (-),score=37.52 TRINITY_DN10414_c0_g1_i1:116-697(-)